MFPTYRFRLLAAAALAAAQLGLAPSASAVTSCGDGVKQGGVSLTCSAHAGNDNAEGNNSGANQDVNSLSGGAGIFGFADWGRVARYDFDTGGLEAGDSGLSILFDSGSGTEGSWQITDTGSAVYMLAFKAGPNFVLATLLDGASEAILGSGASGRFDDPVADGSISHITLYGRGEPTPPIPLPAGVVLILTAFAGAAAVSARSGRTKRG